MSRPSLLLLVLLTSSSLVLFHSLASADTVYDVLKQHGLPMGLLPKGVKDFEIDDSGKFVVRLEKPCTAKFENEVRYEASVSGNISYGQIGELKGISAQELFLWFPVKGIRVDIPSSGIIYFDVGVIFKQFSLSLFEIPPDCKEEEMDMRVLVREGEEIARVVSESKSGKLRYMLDNNLMNKAAM